MPLTISEPVPWTVPHPVTGRMMAVGPGYYFDQIMALPSEEREQAFEDAPESLKSHLKIQAGVERARMERRKRQSQLESLKASRLKPSMGKDWSRG